MGMLRWTRWWLTVLVVGAMCMHIVNAANEGNSQRAHFKSVPKLNSDGTRDIDLPTAGRRGWSPAQDELGWFDLFANLFDGRPAFDPSALEGLYDMPVYDGAGPPPQRSGRREGSLDRVVSKSGRNDRFGTLTSR